MGTGGFGRHTIGLALFVARTKATTRLLELDSTFSSTSFPARPSSSIYDSDTITLLRGVQSTPDRRRSDWLRTRGIEFAAGSNKGSPHVCIEYLNSPVECSSTRGICLHDDGARCRGGLSWRRGVQSNELHEDKVLHDQCFHTSRYSPPDS